MMRTPAGMFTPTLRHLEACRRLRALVIGDLMLDHYLRGVVERTSPEAPVPVLCVKDDAWIAGGAGNVAANLAAMGARVEMAGVVGADDNAPRALALLETAGNRTGGVVRDPSRPTTLKTRALAQGQQILRIDREDSRPVSEPVARQLLRRARRALDRVDGVVISDYAKGTLGAETLSALIRMCREAGKPVIGDPKGLDYRRYAGVDCLTPNEKEAQAASGVAITDEASLRRAAAALNRQVGGRAICVTRGAQGVAVFPRRGEAVFLPALAREVYDVTGAGDTFTAHLALGFFQGLSLAEAAAWGNLAAGIVVGKLGAATVSPGELLGHAAGERHLAKLHTAAELEPILASLRAAGRRVVFTNGCFDLLHVGHIQFLETARSLGDCLVVAINSDESVRRVKGAPRPLLPEAERAALLASLNFVDYVVVFGESSPEPLLRRLRPDVLVKGGGLRPEEVVGREIVEAAGGEARVLPMFGDRSVSQLLDQWAKALGGGAAKSRAARTKSAPARPSARRPRKKGMA